MDDLDKNKKLSIYLMGKKDFEQFGTIGFILMDNKKIRDNNFNGLMLLFY